MEKNVFTPKKFVYLLEPPYAESPAIRFCSRFFDLPRWEEGERDRSKREKERENVVCFKKVVTPFMLAALLRGEIKLKAKIVLEKILFL